MSLFDDRSSTALVELVEAAGFTDMETGTVTPIYQPGSPKPGSTATSGSKERLQLETVALGLEIFRDHVVAPAQQAPPGQPRLWALCTAYLAYVAAKVFPGGDFFGTVANEYDTPHRPGPRRDRRGNLRVDATPGRSHRRRGRAGAPQPPAIRPSSPSSSRR